MAEFEVSHPDPEVRRVMQSLMDGIEESLQEMMGLTMQEQVERWNLSPLERRKEIAGWLLGRPAPGEEVTEVHFACEGGDGLDPNAVIVVNLKLARPIEQVSCSITLRTEEPSAEAD